MDEFFPADIKAVCAIDPYYSSLIDPMSRAQDNIDLAPWAKGDLDREQSQAVARFLQKYDTDDERMYFLAVVTSRGQVYTFDRNAINLPTPVEQEVSVVSSPNCSTTKGKIMLGAARASESYNIKLEAPPRPAITAQ